MRMTEEQHAAWKAKEARRAGLANVELQTKVVPAATKYRNVPTDGYHSKREAARASVLKLMQESGQIRNLREQVKYLLIPKQDGERECSYVADFCYEEFASGEWREAVEDVKGCPDQKWPIKRKLMLFIHGIRVREIK